MLYWGDLRVPEGDYILRLPLALRSSYDLWLVLCAGLRITLLWCCLVPVALCAEVEITPVCGAGGILRQNTMVWVHSVCSGRSLFTRAVVH